MSKYDSWPTEDVGNIVGTRLANEIYHRFDGLMNGLAFNDQKDAALTELIATTAETFNVRSFGAKGDGVSDDTAAFEDAIVTARASADVGAIIFVPAGTYLVDQIQLYSGMALRGASPANAGNGGSVIIQPDGVNDDLIVPRSIASGAWWHWAHVADLRLVKKDEAGTTTDTVGSGFSSGANARMGELTVFERIEVRGFPEHGISFLRGGQPCFIHDVRVFNNGTYGLHVKRGAGDVWQLLRCTNLSGDNNGSALVGIDTLGQTTDILVFDGVKSESAVAGKQEYVFEFENTNGWPFYVSHVSHVLEGSGEGTAFFHNTSTDPCAIYARDLRADTMTNLIVDDNASVTITRPSTPFDAWTYHGDGIGQTFYTTVRGLHLPEVATADLPSGAAALNGVVLIEDGGSGDQNLIVYADGQRFRIDGGTAF